MREIFLPSTKPRVAGVGGAAANDQLLTVLGGVVVVVGWGGGVGWFVDY